MTHAGRALLPIGSWRRDGRANAWSTMSSFDRYFEDPDFVARYVDQGPAAFMPGHAGVLQMAGILLAEAAPADSTVLVVGAGGGLDTRALAQMEPSWRFVGVDPSSKMLELAGVVLGEALSER